MRLMQQTKKRKACFSTGRFVNVQKKEGKDGVSQADRTRKKNTCRVGKIEQSKIIEAVSFLS